MGNYLYLIPFLDGNYFKIGISSNRIGPSVNYFSRVKSICDTYSADIEFCLIITGNGNTAKLLEVELLTVFPNIDEGIFSRMIGYTEVRDIKYLNEALSIIKNKDKSLCIEINQYIPFREKQIDLYKGLIKRKNLDLTTGCIRNLSKESIDKDTVFKLHAESILENYAKDIISKKHTKSK